MSLTAKVEEITPELAKLLLRQNTRNRSLRQADVDKYARDMKAGRWRTTGEAIKISESGVLLDGQHRLHAVIKAGVPVKTLVVWGVEDEAQHVMDTGAKRSVADALQLNGVKNAHLVAGGARVAMLWESGRLHRAEGGMGYRSMAYTTSEVEQWLAKHLDFTDSVSLILRIRSRVPCPPSVLIAAHWHFAQTSRPDANRFFESLATLENLPSGSPILALYRALARVREKGLDIYLHEYAKAFTRAWRYWRNGQSISSIVITGYGRRKAARQRWSA